MVTWEPLSSKACNGLTFNCIVIMDDGPISPLGRFELPDACDPAALQELLVDNRVYLPALQC